jgi:hypothetical protein
MTSIGNTGEPNNPPLGEVPMYLSPYEYWNFGRGRPYAFPGIREEFRFLSALAEYRIGSSAEPDAGPAAHLVEAGTWVPTLWREPGLTFVPFVVETPPHFDMSPEALQELLRNALPKAVPPSFAAIAKPAAPIPEQLVEITTPRFRVAFPVAAAAMSAGRADAQPSRPCWEPDPGLRGRIGPDKRITIVAVIDDGIPFAHRHFRDATGRRSRVEFCWLQSVAAERQDQSSVTFGREYTRTEVEGYIENFGNDEDTLYREAGATADTEELGSLLNLHATHGAHVMDLATGYAPERGEEPAEEIRIIAVQLPNTIALDTSGFGKDMYMLSAFHYIFDRADLIAEKYNIARSRLVINFSYGFSGGRHDAGTELEAAIEQLVEKRRECRGPTALVLPAGNMFLDRLHGMIRDDDFVDGTATFHWRIQPNDRTPSYLEIWFWEGFNPFGYTVELCDPSGRNLISLPIGSDPSRKGSGDPRTVKGLLDDAGAYVGQISADYHRSERWRVLVVMAPSEPEKDNLPGTQAGKWRVTIRREDRVPRLEHAIHCWIQRAADPETLRSGSRQSYFNDRHDILYGDDGALSEVDVEGAFVRRFGSLNGLATGRCSLIVAGYRLGKGLGSSLKDARPAHYSSAGTLERGWPAAKVACSSMSDRSGVLAGTVAAGVRSGALSFVQGTSAAAPFVARQLATAFVTADDACVEEAASENYRPLLSGYRPTETCALTKARLGVVRVPPHWQPGIER